jgi:GxxExxY protein
MSEETYNPDLMYPELSHAIIGAAFDVHNELGPGWNEWDYHRAVLSALKKKGITAESHLREKLVHRDEPVDEFELDILVESKIILELKHIRSEFLAPHYIQIINYLKRWGKSLGILINFGMEKLCYKRVPYTPVEGEISFAGCWGDFERQRPECAENIRQSLENILELQGLGYGADSFKKILFRELIYKQMNPEMPEAAPRFNDLSFEPRLLDCILLESGVLVSVTALRDTSATDLARLRSGMKQISCPLGVLVNFGKSKLTLRGAVL